MAVTPPSPSRYRFGSFELNLEGKELLESGKRLHTGEQTFRLLELLLRHADRLVTRQQLRQDLWPDGTFVDFERSINSAMRRLRRVLKDDSDEPRYIATLTGQGYRFIAPVERVEEGTTHEPTYPPAPVADPRPARRWRWWAGAAAAVVVLLALTGWEWARLEPQPEVLHIRALTTDGGMDLPARPASYGPLIYYLDRAGGHWNLMSSSGNPASARVVRTPFENTRLMAISPDGTEWLLGNFNQRGEEEELWRQAQPGGAPVRLGNLQAYDAVWDPDGAHIEYSHGNGLWEAAADGSAPHKLAQLASPPDWLDWSPDGKQLRFFAGSTLYEWRPGQPARALPFDLPRCCGTWSRDGRYFFFSAQVNGLWTLWAQRVAEPWPWRLLPGPHPAPVQLISLPRDSFGAYTGFGHDQVVFYEVDPLPDAERCTRELSDCQPLLPGRPALEIRFSPGGKQLVYRDARDRSLWSADVGPGFTAQNFRQLTPPGDMAGQPHWSPDGRWIAYSSQARGKPARAWRVEADGGPPQPLVGSTAAGVQFSNPDWSPDGKHLVADEDRGNAHGLVILTAGKVQAVPGSARATTPHWSPDGRWLSAISTDQTQVLIYSFAGRRWRTVAQGHAFSGPLWGTDGRYLYYQDLLGDGEPVYRMQEGVWKPELVVNFTSILRGGIHRCAFMGLAPDGELMLTLNGSSSDLYAATLKLP